MTLRFIACLLTLALAACGTAFQNKEPPPKPFTMTKWQVVLEREPSAQHLQPWFLFADGVMEGFGGCNPVAARYVQDTVGARAIVIGKLNVERGGCDVRGQLVQTHILEVLQAVSSYTITGDIMVMSGSGGSLTLRAAAAGMP